MQELLENSRKYSGFDYFWNIRNSGVYAEYENIVCSRVSQSWNQGMSYLM
jgi:hypothetical protein